MQRAFRRILLGRVRNHDTLRPALNRKQDQRCAEKRNVAPESHC